MQVLSPPNCPSSSDCNEISSVPQQNPSGRLDYTNFVIELMLYNQKPGVAEAEYQTNVNRTFRRLLYAMSGDAPADLMPSLVTKGPLDGHYLDRIPEPEQLPDWLTEEELDYYTREYERTGFTGAFNRYRNIDSYWMDHEKLGET